MQEGNKDLTESVSTKTELRQEQNGKGPEAVFARTKLNTRARLLKRCTSQSLLLTQNKKDGEQAGRSRQDSVLSSSISGLLFARPLSSTSREQAKPSLFPRAKSSVMSATIPACQELCREVPLTPKSSQIQRSHQEKLQCRLWSEVRVISVCSSININIRKIRKICVNRGK